MFQFTLKTEATYVAADPSEPKEVLNLAGAKCFYKNAADVDSGDTELAAAATVTITEGTYFVSASSSEIGVRELDNLQVGDNMTVAGTAAVAGAASVGGKLTAKGEVEIDGDLNHDGAKVGFFGTAPAAQPDLKPAAEVTAKELGEALVTLGLIK